MKAKDRANWSCDVVGVATELFLSKGYDATSMEEVGAALGVSKPTIYEAFPSKQDLLAAVVDAALRGYEMSWLEAAARDEMPFEPFIDLFAKEFWGHLGTSSSGAIFRLLLLEGPRSPDLVATYVRRMKEPGGHTLRDVLSSAMARGECRKMDPTIVQHMFLAPGFLVLRDRLVFGKYAMTAELAAAYLDASRQALKDSLVLKPASKG